MGGTHASKGSGAGRAGYGVGSSLVCCVALAMTSMLLVAVARVAFSPANQATRRGGVYTGARSPGLHADSRPSPGGNSRGGSSRGRGAGGNLATQPEGLALAVAGVELGRQKGAPAAAPVPTLSRVLAAAVEAGTLAPAGAGGGGQAVMRVAKTNPQVTQVDTHAHDRNQYIKRFRGGLGAMTAKELGIKPGQSHLPRLRECSTAIGIRQKYHISKRLGNTLMFIAKALMVAEDRGVSLLISPPGDRYYNTSVFCVPDTFAKGSAAGAKHGGRGGAGGASGISITTGNFKECYSPCDCGGDFGRFRRVLQQYVLPHMFVSPRVLPDPETVVLHVRSGDVMRTKRGVKYWQPPAKYYKYIIETFHPNSPIIICTEIHGEADGKAGGNPVVAELLKWRPGIIFPETDLGHDVSVLLSAKYFVQATSSLSKSLASMSDRVVRTYVPRVVKSDPGLDAAGIAGGFSSACCACRQRDPRHRKITRSWGCGADKKWKQKNGQPVKLVEVFLPNYDVTGYSGNMDFAKVKKSIIEYDGPVCTREWPKQN